MDHLVKARRVRKLKLLRYIEKTPDFFDEEKTAKYIMIFADSVGISPNRVKEYLKELEATEFSTKQTETKEEG